MSETEFALPNDLGWECNDEISRYIDDWMEGAVNKVVNSNLSENQEWGAWMVAKAELMDNIYAIIKRYQDA